MPPDFQALMAKATDLTRAGRLQEATAVIQQAMAASGTAAAMPSASAWGDFAKQAGAAPAVDEILGQRERQSRPSYAASRPIPAFDPAGITDLPWRPATQGATLDRNNAATPDGTRSANRTTNSNEIVRGSFTEPSVGTRQYRLYVPPHAAGQHLPLVVMLHGCTQNAEDFARGTRMDDAARREGFAVLYPEQCAKANPQRCWNWFRKKDQGREGGEPALLAGMVRHLVREHDLDAGRVFVAGLSAGGAMAATLGRTHPDLFAAVGVHSGLAAGSASDLPSAIGAMRGGAGKQAGDQTEAGFQPVPTIVFHGGADLIVHPSNGERIIAQATPAGGRIDRDDPRTSGMEGTAAGSPRRPATRTLVRDGSGKLVAEHWVIAGAPHAWSGGNPAGSYTDPAGPDATAEMVRFFLARD